MIDDVPNFDSESFVDYKKEYYDFYMEFSQTQIFRQFLQNDYDDCYQYFYKIINKIKYENKKNIFSRQYLEKCNLLGSDKARRRSNSNNNFINRINSKNFIDFNNDSENFNNNEMNKKNKNAFNKHVIINNEYDGIIEFRENFYLYPYFLDFDQKLKISNKIKSEFLMDYESIDKYISSIFNDEDIKKNLIITENGFTNIKENENLNRMNGFAKDVNKRIFNKFRYLNMENIPENFIRYSIPDDYYNVPSVNYQPKRSAFNLRSIILEITQKFETNSIKDNHTKKEIKDCLSEKNNTNEGLINNFAKSKSIKRKITIQMY